MRAGATKEEIVETIRVAQYINGVGVFTPPPAHLKTYLSGTIFDLVNTVKEVGLRTSPTKR